MNIINTVNASEVNKRKECIANCLGENKDNHKVKDTHKALFID